MKFKLLADGYEVMNNILAKNEEHAWNIIQKMGITNKSNIYKLKVE